MVQMQGLFEEVSFPLEYNINKMQLMMIANNQTLFTISSCIVKKAEFISLKGKQTIWISRIIWSVKSTSHS
jgi:hypothetical protein